MTTRDLLKQEIEFLDENYLELVYKIVRQFPHRAKQTAEPITRDNAAALFADFAQDPVIGMWQDREEMRDSTAWVRELRRTQWREHS